MRRTYPNTHIKERVAGRLAGLVGLGLVDEEAVLHLVEVVALGVLVRAQVEVGRVGRVVTPRQVERVVDLRLVLLPLLSVEFLEKGTGLETTPPLEEDATPAALTPEKSLRLRSLCRTSGWSRASMVWKPRANAFSSLPFFVYTICITDVESANLFTSIHVFAGFDFVF